jgi:DNA-binding MarR family transcriptional regulator/N-acetylglutamate synthase-like GNAT family acetyltransferase
LFLAKVFVTMTSPELQFDPATAIKRAIRIFARFQANLDRAVSKKKQSPTERRVLLELLANPGSTDAQVGRALALERSLLSRTLKQLIVEGLIRGVQSSRHRAQRLLSLTEEGLNLANVIDKDLDRAIREVFGKLPRDDEDQLLKASGATISADLNGDPEHGEVKIRPVGLRDYSPIFGLLTFGGHTEYQWSDPYISSVSLMIHQFIKRQLSEHPMGWVAYRGKRLVGVCLLLSSEDALNASIGALHVVPDLRRRTIGSTLLGLATSQALTLTMSRVTAVASERQFGANRTFLSAGFIRSKDKDVDYRYGKQDTWRNFELKLPCKFFETSTIDGQIVK